MTGQALETSTTALRRGLACLALATACSASAQHPSGRDFAAAGALGATAVEPADAPQVEVEIELGAGRSSRSVDAVRRILSRSVSLAAQDRNFLAAAHRLDVLQIVAATLAQTRATRPALRSLAGNLLAAHRRSRAVLLKLAASSGVPMTTRLDAEDETRIEALQKAAEADFDTAFVRIVVLAQKRLIALCEATAASSADSDIRSLAEDLLPTLRTQMADARQVETALGQFAAAP